MSGDEIFLEPIERARRVLPGGVNSPVRAFAAVGGQPPFIASAAGCRLYDEDDNEWIDFISSWGAILFGHADPEIVAAVTDAAAAGTSFGLPTEREVEAAELVVGLVPSIEMVRWVNSGTEATMSALRLARAVTGRDKILKFEGCYHGHADPLLVAAGSGVATFGLPDSPGVPASTAADTLVARYNDLNTTEQAFDAAPLAAVIVEPIAGNMGVVPAESDFMVGLAAMCQESGTLLIFDEVMSGFRVAAGGAQELYGVTPDLTTLGKILGHGLPAAAFGGRRDLMENIAPVGPVYQAGTLSGNPLAIAAGVAALERIDADASAQTPAIYAQLEERSARIEAGLDAAIDAVGAPCHVQRVGSMWTLFFTDEPVREYADGAASDVAAFGRFHRHCAAAGVMLPPSAFETCFTTLAHDDAAVDETIATMSEALERTYA